MINFPHTCKNYFVTSKAVQEDEEPVALPAIEFWSSICNEEIEIQEDYQGDFSGLVNF